MGVTTACTLAPQPSLRFAAFGTMEPSQVIRNSIINNLYMNPNWKIIRKAVIASSILIACFAVFIIFSDKQEAKADINPMLNFTGKITDSDSAAVADNVYDFSFGLYTTATSGTAIWSEDLTAANMFSGAISAVSTAASSTTYTYTSDSNESALRVGQYLTNASTTEYELITDYNTTANTVTVVSTTAWDVGEGINNRPRTVGGVVDIDLGSVSSLASVDFNQTLYLQVTFNSETMQPRKLITAVAQAFNADKLDGYDASDFANIADDVTVTGEWDFANVVGIATSSTTTALTVTQSNSGDIVNLFSGSDEVLTVLSSGYVGIGTTTPYSKLSIWGSGNLLELVDTSSTTVFRVDDSGNLTITGTTTMGALTYPSYDGTAGQAILTDSNGNLYWGDSTGGGTVQTGLAGRLAFYPSGGIIVDDADYLFWDDTNDRLAIGTTSPYSKLTVWGDGTSGLSTFSVIDSASTTLFTVLDSGKVGIGTSSPSYQLDIYGGGNLLRVASSSGDLFTVTDSQITSGVPHSFSGSGDVDIAHNLYFSNPSAANIKSYGPLYITSGDPGTNTNLYLEGQGAGQVYIDDKLTVTGSTTMAVWNNVIVVDGTTYAATGAGIQAAIDALPAEGGKVFIPEGTYSITSTITVPSNVWLEGAGASSTVLYNNGIGDSVIENADTTNGNSHIKISNLKIDGNDPGTCSDCHGIYFNNVTYSQIDSVYVYDADDYGIYFNVSASSTISNNILESNLRGVYFNSSSNNIINSNNSNNNSQHGIHIVSGSNNTIADNISNNNTGYGVWIDDSAYNNIIIGNIISNNSIGINIFNYADNNIVTGNTSNNNSQHGIYLFSSSNNIITGNTFNNNSQHGIYILSVSNNNTVTGNTVYDNGAGDTYHGIYLSGSDYNLVSSNNIYDSAGDGDGIFIDSASEYNLIVGNKIRGVFTEKIDNDDSTTEFAQPSRLTIQTTTEQSYSPFYMHASSTVALLSVRQDSTGDIVNIFDGVNEVFTILDGGFVGIGTTTPWSKLTVDGSLFLEGSDNYINFGTATSTDGYGFYDNSGTLQFKNSGGTWIDLGVGTVGDGIIGQFPYYASAGSALTATSSIFLDTTGYIGIGTTSPQTLLTVYKSTDDALISFGDQNSNTAHWYMGTDYSDSSKFKIASSSLLSIAEFTFTKDGYLGIGATSPQAALHIGTASTSNLTTFNDSLFVSGELEVGETVYLGPMEFGANSGAISWIDMPVTSFAAAGTVESYTARIDNISLLTVYSESDGAGGVQNTGVGIGTTTPFGFLSVSASSTDPALVIKQVDSSNQGPIAVFYDGGSEKIRFDSSGRVGIGTSSPYATLSLVGTAGQDNPLLQIATTSPLSGATTSAEQYFTVSNLGDTTINGRVLNPTHAGKIGNGDGGAELTGPRSVYVSGNYAYVTAYAGNALEIVDISDPTNPTHAGKSGAVLHNPNSVYVSGNYAYVTAYTGNALEIVDISDPTNPTHAGKIADGDGGAELTGAYSVYVSGNYAYVAAYSGDSLEIVDISDPTNPTHAGKIADGDGGAALNGARSVYVSGNYAYVAALVDHSLEIVDISDPTNPIHAGKISDGNGEAELTNVASVYVSGNYAYAAALIGDALEIVDISDPANPTHAGKIADGDGGAELNGANGVYVSGNYAYVGANDGDALEIVDISSSTNPVHAAKITNGAGGAELTGAYSVYVSGNYAYVAAWGDNSLEIIDISGLTVSNMYAGAIKTDNLQVMSRAQFNQDVDIHSGLTIGSNGLLSRGTGAFSLTSTSTDMSNLYAIRGVISDENVSGITDILNLTHTASSTTANGIGAGLLFSLEHDGGFATSTARIASILTDVTEATPASALTFYTKNTSGSLTERMRLDSNGYLGIGTSSPLTTLSVQGTAGTPIMNIASSTGESVLYVDEYGRVGIGTMSPSKHLHIFSADDNAELAIQSGTNNYWGISQVRTDDSLGTYDSTGDLRFWNGANLVVFSDTGVGIGTDFGTTGPLEDLSIYGAGYGDDQYFGLGVKDNRKWKFWAAGHDEQAGYGDYPLIIQRDMDDNTGDFVVQGDSDFVIEKSGNVGIGTSSPYSKLTVWGDGDSGLSAFSVVDSASSTLFTVLDNGYVGIGTASPSYNLEVVGTVSFGSDTGGDILFDTTTITNQVLVGIGTSTPDADLTIVSDQVNANTYLFTIATSTSGSDVIDRKFAVDSDGDIWYDGSAMGPAADYAEYFYTVDTDLESGETVCVDITRNNAVKRCARGADGNVMGIVSTKPAIIGNAKEEYLNSINYKIIGMLGQVQACVSNENGEIRPGDSLTSASSTPGCAMRAGAGDPTVGIALEGLEDTKCPIGHLVSGACTEDTECPIGHSVSGARTGVINVLISRRNKSLTVEMVEAKITDRIAAMEIEDEVQILISQAVDNLDLDSEIQGIVDEQMALLSSNLTVEVNAVSGELMAIAVSVDELVARMNVVENNIMDIDSRLALFEGENIYSRLQTGIVVDENGNIKMGSGARESVPTASAEAFGPLAAVVEIITATTTTQTAFVVNQAGDGDVADFRADGVSVVNIGDTGKVTIIGEMLVDGRIMVCSGGACGSALDERVDETMGDLGVEGTVVAGAFEGYCEHGWIWVNGLAKYGTMPGFCVMVRKSIANNIANNREYNEPWTDISQGEAMLACQEIGDGYHLISENEWLTVAENIIRVAENDIDEAEGLQLATSTPIYANDTPNNANIASSSIAYVLSNGNVIYGLVGEVAEWTDRTVTKAGLIEPVSDEWLEYYEIENYNGFNIAPPYYYSSENGIGKIKTGDNGAGLRGFVRGYDGIYSLDLSYAPTAATSSIGFRCAR